MSRKISDYFKIDDKKIKSKVKPPNCEKDSTELDENQQNFDDSPQKVFKLRDCRVILSDIRIKSRPTRIRPKILKNFDFPCKYCDSIFDERRYWLYHVQKDHPDEEIFDCEFCKLRFSSLRSLQIHIGSIHPECKKDQIYECDFDGKIFESKLKILLHMNTHMSPIECLLCGEKISIKWMKIHMRITHRSEGESQCDICFKILKSKGSLTKHKKIHDKKFSCDNCDRKFITLGKLNIHKVVHDNLRNFECDQCDKKFNLKSYLRAHKQSHDETRKNRFKCHQCKFKTYEPATLRKHEAFHKRQNEKIAALVNPVKCEICEKLCKDKKALVQHNYFVHPKELHQCDLCGRYLKKRHHLQRHMQLVHLSKRNKDA